MTLAFRNRWILVAALWVGAIIFALWNMEAISRIASTTETMQTLAANRRFIEAHQADFDGLDQRVKSLTRIVDSPAFGLLYLEQELSIIADENGLSEFKLEGQPESGAKGSLPVSVTFDGALSDATRWLAAVQERLPYVLVTGLDVATDPQAPAAKFTVIMTFRYQIAAPQA